MALIEPLNVALPSLSKWKPLELISMLPSEPLTYCVELPRKKADELISTLEPSNLKNSPADFPINALGVPLL